MPNSFYLPNPDHFTVGAIGPPGQRVFYLQAGEAGLVVSFKLEKQQVAALAEYLASLLSDMPTPDEPLITPPALIEPIVPEWTVGGIGIAVDEEGDRLLLVVHELIPEPEAAAVEEAVELLAELASLVAGDTEFDEDDDDDFDDEDEFDETPDGAIARVRLSRIQVAAFIQRTDELMESGRPLCPFCGLPRNPEGHMCPRAN